MEIKDWYQKRNDRINRIENVRLDYLKDKPVAVIIGRTDANRYSNQITALISLDLLSKWNSCISIEIHDSIICCVPNNPATSLKHALQDLISKNDPFGKFTFSEKLVPSEFEYILIIGNDDRNFPSNSIWIDSDNWISGASNMCLYYNKPDVEIKNPAGPVFAACLGNALLFKKYNEGALLKPFKKWYSLYDFKSSESADVLQNPLIPDKINIGEIFQIGCGAVGSSLDFLLTLANFEGKIFLIDYDHVKYENICSSLIFNYNDAEKEFKKTEVCQKYLKKNQLLEIIAYDGDYSNFLKSIDYFHDQYPSTILCLANEKNVWATVQINLPPVVYHATTSPNWVINFGRHIPQKEWCIVCRFGIDNSDNVLRCSSGMIENKEEKGEFHLGTLPFLAPAAATLIISELIKKNSYSDYPTCPENFIQFSMKFDNMNEFILLRKNKVESCPICRTQELTDYPVHFKNKFAKFL